MNDNPSVAIKWLEEAALRAAAAPASNDTTRVITERNQEANIQQVLKNVERKLPPGFRDLDSMEDDEDGTREYRLGHIPPKTRDPNKYKTEDDEINYRALCRGKRLLPEEEASKLKCYFSNLRQPFYFMGPMKIEVAHRPPHQVVLFHDFLTHDEADELVELGKPKLMQASIGSDKLISDLRVAKNAWLEDDIPVVDNISKRINMATGLQTARKFDRFNEGKTEEYELLQVINVRTKLSQSQSL